MSKDKKMHRDDILAHLREAGLKLAGAKPFSLTISAQKSKIVDGKIQVVTEDISYEVRNQNLAESIKVLELYGRETGLGFDGTTTMPDERPTPPIELGMSEEAVIAYMEHALKRHKAAKRWEELGVTPTIDQLLGVEE